MTEKTYISSLSKEQKEQLDNLIENLSVYSGDSVYADIIVPRANVVEFITTLTRIGIVVKSINWWCNATEENKNKYGCPHGYGGPMTKDGWFTELVPESDSLSEIEMDLFLSLDMHYKTIAVKAINDKSIEIINTKKTSRITNEDET